MKRPVKFLTFRHQTDNGVRYILFSKNSKQDITLSCLVPYVCLLTTKQVNFVLVMVKLYHKLLIQFYFDSQTPMCYAASILLCNLIEAVLEIILYYTFKYCGLL